jgi:hypothetical protein
MIGVGKPNTVGGFSGDGEVETMIEWMIGNLHILKRNLASDMG